MKNILVIGAGPAGLASAHELAAGKNAELKVAIIEMDKAVGGVSKTVNFDGYYYDLGGHRFFSKIKEVNDLWNKTLPNDFLTRKRLSRIYYNHKFFAYPLQIKNALFNFGFTESILIVFSFLKAKIFPFKEETNFEQWVSNRFGKRLYNAFFQTYTEKLWGISCKEIRAEWAAQRIKGLSLSSAVLNALSWDKEGNKIKTLISEFKYPKYGSGMMYEAMKDNIIKNKNFKIHLNSKLTKLSYKNNEWEATINQNGSERIEKYDQIISTMPITEFILNMDYPCPSEIKAISSKLKYRDFLIVCLVFDQPNKLKDNWIYIHDENIKSGRLQILNNWGSTMLKNPKHSSYSAEYFCNEGDEIWNKADQDLIKLTAEELKESKLIAQNYNCLKGNVVRVKKAYPVYDELHAENISKLIEYVKTIPQLQVAGRYGMFKYNNMDHSIYTGILAARNVLSGENKFDTWTVNQDEEYHEIEKNNI